MRDVSGTMVRDSLSELVAPETTALLVVDVQNDFCHDDGHFARHGKDMAAVKAVLPGIRSFVAAAREHGVKVVFIQQATLPDGASDTASWLRFKSRDGKTPDYTLPGSWGWQFVDGLEPRRDELVVQKFRPDGFHRTGLDEHLRAAGIESVIVLGVITEGCVESTIRSASYHDYYVVVVGDNVA
ncbi:MAG: cysteine hydrolase, partial [Alphaproteobacteria bacterium]|nr:cysteine hydrolase [Alphaproteobacteria bacterium]